MSNMTRKFKRRRVKRVSGNPVVYGVGCVWWDSIDKAVLNGAGLPSCPHCGSLLMQVPSIEAWWRGVDKFEAEGNKNYRVLMELLRGRCFTSMAEAREAIKQGEVPA